MGALEFMSGKKTIALAAVQSLATFAQLAGFVTPEQLTTLSQAIGLLFSLSLGHKVVKAAQG